MAEHGFGGIVKLKTMRRTTKYRKWWRAMIAHVQHGTNKNVVFFFPVRTESLTNTEGNLTGDVTKLYHYTNTD